MLVRRAAEGDLIQLEDVLRCCRERVPEKVRRYLDESYSSVEAFRGNLRAQNLYVAAVPTRPVAGALAIDACPDADWAQMAPGSGGTISFVHQLMVHPCCQRRGVGRFLMQFAEAWARRSGSGVIRIGVPTGNVAALQVCDALGYRQAKSLPLGRGDLSCFEKVLT